MDIKRLIKKAGFLLALTIFLGNASLSEAAGGSISVIPQSGKFVSGQKFQAQIKIDGGGTRFNAAKANISVSDNLRVEGVTLGDCGFAFVDTPSTSSLSFAGVILGDSSLSCTAYTISLRVIGPNSGSVFVTDGSLKSYDGAQEILENVVNSNYTFPSSGDSNTAMQVTPTQQPLISSSGEKMYTLVYTVPSEKESDVKDLSVVLDANLPTQMTSEIAPLPSDPTVFGAIFDNVPEGVHTVDVLSGSEKVSSEIVNVEGESREISLGVAPKPSTTPLLMIALVAVGLITLISALILGYIFYKKKIRNNL